MDQKTCVTWPIYCFKKFVTFCYLVLASNIPCIWLILQEYVQYGFRSDVTKFEPDLTCLATVRAPSVNMLHMSIFFTLTWPVTLSVTSRSTKLGFVRQFWWGYPTRRLNFENRTSGFGDRRGALNSPPPSRVMECSQARVYGWLLHTWYFPKHFSSACVAAVVYVWNLLALN